MMHSFIIRTVTAKVIRRKFAWAVLSKCPEYKEEKLLFNLRIINEVSVNQSDVPDNYSSLSDVYKMLQRARIKWKM